MAFFDGHVRQILNDELSGGWKGEDAAGKKIRVPMTCRGIYEHLPSTNTVQAKSSAPLPAGFPQHVTGVPDGVYALRVKDGQVELVASPSPEK